MPGRKYGIPMALLVLLGPAVAVADDSMRCGRYLVHVGDSQARVLDVCGEPRSAWHDGFIEQTVRNGDGYYDPTRPVPPYPYPGQPGYGVQTRRILAVYKWEYNLGPGTFLRTLVFHGDTLVDIISGPRQ